MDRDLRKLERLAATGDQDAADKLARERDRAFPPVPMTPTEEVVAVYLGDQRRSEEATLDVSYNELSYTLNTFHFVTNMLVYSEDLQNQYDLWVEENDDDHRHHLWDMEHFVESLPDAAGIYGDGEPFVVNTYNHESAIDEVLQYIYWEDDNGAHVMLQFHRGGDVRGNYSPPTAFDLDENHELGLLDNARGLIDCSNEECGETVVSQDNREYLNRTRWYSDDAYNWYGDGDEPNLKDLEIVELEDDPLAGGDITSFRPDEDLIIVVDGEPRCPVCRTGTLCAVPFGY